MKFALSCAKNFIREEDPLMAKLESEGFTFDEQGYHDCRPTKEFNAIEDLIAFCQKFESKVVFDPFPCDWADDKMPTITIYNDYLE